MFKWFKKKSPLKEGDKATDDLKYNKQANAFISICPCCNRIDKIFIP